MNILVYCSQGKKKEAKCFADKCGFCTAHKNPDMILCYGGDGTFLKAEAEYPGLPKMPIRASQICKLCSPVANEEMVEYLKNGQYSIKEIMKLEARVGDKSLQAINDIIVHNSDPRHAIRYQLFINNKQIGETIIGDGIVVSTPFGAGGYYRSITNSVFDIGLGLAFNNSTEASDHLVLNDDAKLFLTIARGPATVYADNQKEFITLFDNQAVEIKKSPELARLITISKEM